MGERDALYRVVIENPSDDAPRLVFADWLEEHGEPERAEFIRVQIEYARLGVHDERGRALLAHADKLARGRKLAWKAELPRLKGVSWDNFSRGFSGGARFSSLYWCRVHLGRVVAAAPVTSVSFNPRRSGGAVSLTSLAASPHLARVTLLRLEMLRLTDDAIVPLARARHLGRLERLSLDSNQLTGAGVALLAGSTAFPSLKSIELTRNPIGPDVVPALLESPWVRNLQSLSIDERPLGPAAAAILTEALDGRVLFPLYR